MTPTVDTFPLIAPLRKTEAKNRLGRIEGQVKGLQRMIDEDRYCIDFLNQLSAVQAALSSVGRVILRNYLENCATQAIRHGEPEDRERVYEELMDVVYKYIR